MGLVPDELRCHLTSSGKAKRRYRTLEAAQAAAARMPSSRKHPYHGYACPLVTCGGFHVGRSSAK